MEKMQPSFTNKCHLSCRILKSFSPTSNKSTTYLSTDFREVSTEQPLTRLLFQRYILDRKLSSGWRLICIT